MMMAEKVEKSPFMKLCRKLSPSRKHDNSRSLQAVFDYMDTDRDGKLSATELQNSIKTLGGVLSEEEAESAVRYSDLDGDGFLGFDEFQNLMEGNGCTEQEKTDELREAFRMYVGEDEEREFITAGSLRKMLKKMGDSSTLEDCRAMIRAFDLDDDGVLSFHEFALMMR